MKLNSKVFLITGLTLTIVFSSIGFATLATNSRLVGDVDSDGRVSIKDATRIQKHLALIETINDIDSVYADVIRDGEITIKDATAIQKHLVGLFKLPDINNKETTAANDTLPSESTSRIPASDKNEPTIQHSVFTTASSCTETQTNSSEPAETVCTDALVTDPAESSTGVLPSSTSATGTACTDAQVTDPAESSTCNTTVQTNPTEIVKPTFNNGIELPDHDWE